MALQTVSTVQRDYGVSTRMLRYYEQCGLIKSMKQDGYAYRVYDEVNLRRLQKVIILRKLQIPVKQIGIILNNPDAAVMVEIFKMNMQELDNEITALSTIRRILERFVGELEAVINVNLGFNFLNSEEVHAITSSLSLVQSTIKEKLAMNELNQAAKVLDKRHQVKLRVELAFNGNCTEAIALYEQAFGIKADGILRYKDAPPEDRTNHPAGTEDYVMHTWLKLGNDPIGEIGMHDKVSNVPGNYGDAVSLSIALASADAVHTAFNTLKTGGTVISTPTKEHFCECFCEVRDRFGVNWTLMYN